MQSKINPQFLILLTLTILMGVWRFFNQSGSAPIVNFTPIGGMALFGGTYFTSKIRGFVFPLLTLLLSDVLLMQFYYTQYKSGLLYDGWYWTYIAFAGMVFIGQYLNKKLTHANLIMSALLAAVLHWLVTDFGVWLQGGRNLLTGLPYTKDISGLIACYMAGLPYLKNLVISNMLYLYILVGSFELIQHKYLLPKKITHSSVNRNACR